MFSSSGISFKIDRYFGRALTYSLLSRYASHILMADFRAYFFLNLSIFCLTISLFMSFGGSSMRGISFSILVSFIAPVFSLMFVLFSIFSFFIFSNKSSFL
jgi:hypothetical protein